MVIASVLLLEALALALLSRRSAAPALRTLLVVTLAVAVSAGLLAGYTEWQMRTLDPHIPFIRLSDNSIQYIQPLLGVSVVIRALPVIGLSAVVVLLGGVALSRFLASGLRILPVRRQ